MTPEQKTILRADIIAKQAVGQPLFGITQEPSIKDYYNALTGTKAWRTDVPTKLVRSKIALNSYTPNAAADDTVIYTNRALLAQTKQTNLQLMMMGIESLDMSLPQARSDLKDAVTQIPTGAAGAAVSAAGPQGANVLNACTRDTSVVELLFAVAADVSDQTGTVTGRVLTFEGAISDQDVSDAILGR